MQRGTWAAIWGLCLASICANLAAAEPPARGPARDKQLAEYFRAETERLAERTRQMLPSGKADWQKLGDWSLRRETYLRQLREMLGLDPLPMRTPLEVKYTGELDHGDFRVKKLHYQSLPGLYVTANLYLPASMPEGKKLPGILYVCGHSRQVKDGVSFGNKAGYQHHGAWFARNGYVCLTIDTLQLGEIQGLHHGTHNLGMWWWVSRGYTPAGVEAWNGIRGLDLLQSLPEVDGERLGVTGRSGGGAYSWWVAALDDRVKAAVPVAGTTDLENHVVDGCVEGHCDCMYLTNTYQWDYPLVAALVAPRPLLISNTDKDKIFPLDGVVRTHALVKNVYQLYGSPEKLGLQITEGPHADTQELHIHAFRWFNRWLRDTKDPIPQVAEKFFQPAELKVFDKLPEDQRNTKIQESFGTYRPEPPVPADAAAWEKLREHWRAHLKSQVFAAWPEKQEPLDLKPVFDAQRDGIRLAAYDFTSQGPIRLRLYVAERAGLEKPELLVLNTLDAKGFGDFLSLYGGEFAAELKDEELPKADEESYASHKKMFAAFPWTFAYVAPRGEEPSPWRMDSRKWNQIRRRFLLLGQTLEGQQVWDLRRATQAVRSLPKLGDVRLWCQGERDQAAVALYASLFEPKIARLDLHELAPSHMPGSDKRFAPPLLNVLRGLDVPQAAALAAENSQVVIYTSRPEDWKFLTETRDRLDWGQKQVQLRNPDGPPTGK